MWSIGFSFLFFLLDFLSFFFFDFFLRLDMAPCGLSRCGVINDGSGAGGISATAGEDSGDFTLGFWCSGDFWDGLIGFPDFLLDPAPLSK